MMVKKKENWEKKNMKITALNKWKTVTNKILSKIGQVVTVKS